MKYIRIIGILILCLLLPLGVSAKRSKNRMPDKPVVADSILQNIFQFSPFYSRIIDEYKADLYLKGKLKVHKRLPISMIVRLKPYLPLSPVTGDRLPI